jgi:hypothetical protein
VVTRDDVALAVPNEFEYQVSQLDGQAEKVALQVVVAGLLRNLDIADFVCQRIDADLQW